jgi:hypothetical protein
MGLKFQGNKYLRDSEKGLFLFPKQKIKPPKFKPAYKFTSTLNRQIQYKKPNQYLRTPKPLRSL